jgi:hypothetical protein
MRLRASYTLAPLSCESGRAKYTYSKMHMRCSRGALEGAQRAQPLSSMTSISPGSMSRTYWRR